MENYKDKNIKLANDIKEFLIKNNLAVDIKLYFNGMSYSWCDDEFYNKEPKIRDNDIGSKYFQYANDNTVSMSFEGPLHHLINYTARGQKRLLEKFNKIFDKNKCYYEQGYTWSLSVYYN